jgi:type I restriction enzyme R subunit
VLERLKSLLALDWRRQTQARARVLMAIQDTLEDGLPRVYSPELYQKKCGVVFEHFYESYPDRDASIYASAS